MAPAQTMILSGLVGPPATSVDASSVSSATTQEDYQHQQQQGHAIELQPIADSRRHRTSWSSSRPPERCCWMPTEKEEAARAGGAGGGGGDDGGSGGQATLAQTRIRMGSGGGGNTNPPVELQQQQQTQTPEGCLSAFRSYWKNHISVVVPGEAARDHLALERTHLSYIRMSTLLSLLSVTVSQLQVLQHAPNPSPSFGYYVMGKPLAASLAVLAIFTVLAGGLRWWRWQDALLRGRALNGGWELSFVAGVAAAIVATVFCLGLAVEVRKEWYS